MDNGDGTWSYVLPPTFDPEARVQGEILTWRYDGQARYSYDPQMPTEFTFVEDGLISVNWRDWFARGTRIDAAGRIWRVEYVDQAALETVLGHPVTELRIEGNAEDAGMEVTWMPLGWSRFDCDARPDREVQLWDNDDRVQVACQGSCDGKGPRQNSCCTSPHRGERFHRREGVDR